MDNKYKGTQTEKNLEAALRVNLRQETNTLILLLSLKKRDTSRSLLCF